MQPRGPQLTDELVQTYRAEAMALLSVNQRARLAALGLTVAIFAAIAATVLTGIVAHTDDVAIPLPALVLLLTSVLFELYADLTVVGAARAALERRIADRLGGFGLIYESAVAPIRKRPPLVAGVRFLQGLGALLVVAVLVAGTGIAFDGQRALVKVTFSVLTAGALISAALSYRDMLRSGAVAAVALEDALSRPPR